LQCLPWRGLPGRRLRTRNGDERRQACFRLRGLRTCHDTGRSFYVGGGTALQLRPADHVNSNDPRMATGDCSLCHGTTDWVSTALPAGHMPNPGNLSCAKCHSTAPNDYTPATLAANSLLHTGISANCGQCHGDTTTALTWFNNFTPKDALLTPSHIPYLVRHRLQFLPCPEHLCGRCIRPDEHDAGQAQLRAHSLQHLP
jgi:hypothetical protein